MRLCNRPEATGFMRVVLEFQPTTQEGASNETEVAAGSSQGQ